MRFGGADIKAVRLAVLVGSAVICLVAAGCGVRGSLDPPPTAKAEGTAKSAEAGDPGENSAAPRKAHEPFVLDGLIR